MERVRERETVRLRVLVNGRADLALIAGAVGVHLPVAGVPVSAVRACLGADALVGRSTHSIDELRRAADEGVDYVTFGPVWETPGKRAFGAPKGPAELARAARVGPPVLALGGVTTIDALRAAAEAGAWGVAGIRVFESQRSAAELAAAVREWFSL